MSALAQLDIARYGALLARALPVVIETDEDHQRLLAEIEPLMEWREEDLAPEEEALLEVLLDLVYQYEQRRFRSLA